MIFMYMKTIILTTISLLMVMPNSAKAEDKSTQIASWIESKINTGGYNGGQCKSLAVNLVKCNMRFPSGTKPSSVKTNVKGVSELFAQVGKLASSIYYIGYSGSQKVCEYKYDMYSGTVTKTK